MHASRLVWRLAAISLLPLATFGTAAGEDDPYLAIKTNAAGTINYVRQSEIEAFADVSASNCILILTNGEDIRVFQNCASVAAGLQDKSLVSFPNDFGTVFVSSPFISDLLSTNNSGCRLNLQNRKFVSVNQSCESVHRALLRE
jgi:hypothetical protein